MNCDKSNLLEGIEYNNTARSATNQANQALHAADPSLRGMQIHDIQHQSILKMHNYVETY